MTYGNLLAQPTALVYALGPLVRIISAGVVSQKLTLLERDSAV